MMLKNTNNGTFHPIMYFESPLPGPENENSVTRYKSKGHHTSGFESREKALEEANNIEVKLKETLYSSVTKELEGDLEWDGEGIPADIQIRAKS